MLVWSVHNSFPVSRIRQASFKSAPWTKKKHRLSFPTALTYLEDFLRSQHRISKIYLRTKRKIMMYYLFKRFIFVVNVSFELYVVKN